MIVAIKERELKMQLGVGIQGACSAQNFSFSVFSPLPSSQQLIDGEN